MCQGRYSPLEIRSRAVLAVEPGQPVGRVAEAYGVNRTTLFRWVRRFNAPGNSGLVRRVRRGRSPLLPPFDLARLNNILEQPHSYFAFQTHFGTLRRFR